MTEMSDAVAEMSDEEFEGLVADALDALPPEIQDNLHNLVFLIEDEPSAEQLRDADLHEHLHPVRGVPPESAGDAHSELLGLYDGMAQTDGDFFGFAEPNRIFIFRGPTLRMCETREDVAAEVMITVFHEVAHHFGIEEDELWDLGWG